MTQLADTSSFDQMDNLSVFMHTTEKNSEIIYWSQPNLKLVHEENIILVASIAWIVGSVLI